MDVTDVDIICKQTQRSEDDYKLRIDQAARPAPAAAAGQHEE